MKIKASKLSTILGLLVQRMPISESYSREHIMEIVEKELKRFERARKNLYEKYCTIGERKGNEIKWDFPGVEPKKSMFEKEHEKIMNVEIELNCEPFNKDDLESWGIQLSIQECSALAGTFIKKEIS